MKMKNLLKLSVLYFGSEIFFLVSSKNEDKYLDKNIYNFFQTFVFGIISIFGTMNNWNKKRLVCVCVCVTPLRRNLYKFLFTVYGKI